MNFITDSHSDNWSVNELELGSLLEAPCTSKSFKNNVKKENNRNNLPTRISKLMAKEASKNNTPLNILIKNESKTDITNVNFFIKLYNYKHFY